MTANEMMISGRLTTANTQSRARRVSTAMRNSGRKESRPMEKKLPRTTSTRMAMTEPRVRAGGCVPWPYMTSPGTGADTGGRYKFRNQSV